MPSIVSTEELLASAANTKQEQTNLPLKITLQAPQSPVPQPSLLPVRFRRSLRESNSVSSGSHKNS